MSLATFQKLYGTEENCRNALFEKRWPHGFVCPTCSCTRFFPRRTTMYECAACGYCASVTANTVLHGTHLPLTSWFLAMYLECESCRGISALELSSKLGVRYATAWYVLHRLRSAMGQREALYLLSGNVDADDVFVGGMTPGRRGRATKKVPALIALSLNDHGNPQFLKIRPVSGWDTASVTTTMQQMVSIEATVATDAMGGFNGLKDVGYEHVFAVSAHLPEDEHFSPMLHTQIANLKAQLHGTYHRSPKKNHIASYFDSFCFRFNRRNIPSIMDRLINACAVSVPLDSLSSS
ncbi:MAG: IS1595 family transposase [Candidatus Dormibacteria bacterium]